jgi:hypothetical protein
MEIITVLGWIVCISAGYFLFTVIVPSLITPNLGFIKTPIRKTEELRKFSKKFKSDDREKTAKKAYEWIIKRYRGKEDRYKVILLFPKVFFQNEEKIIGNGQFLHCIVHNRVFMTILINTGQFSEEDFQKKLEISDFGTIHQYIIMKIGDKKYKVDPFYRIFEEIKNV